MGVLRVFESLWEPLGDFGRFWEFFWSFSEVFAEMFQSLFSDFPRAKDNKSDDEPNSTIENENCECEAWFKHCIFFLRDHPKLFNFRLFRQCGFTDWFKIRKAWQHVNDLTLKNHNDLSWKSETNLLSYFGRTILGTSKRTQDTIHQISKYFVVTVNWVLSAQKRHSFLHIGINQIKLINWYLYLFDHSLQAGSSDNIISPRRFSAFFRPKTSDFSHTLFFYNNQQILTRPLPEIHGFTWPKLSFGKFSYSNFKFFIVFEKISDQIWASMFL